MNFKLKLTTYIRKLVRHTKKTRTQLGFVVGAISSNGKNPTLFEKMIDNLDTFFHIWPLSQWVGSLVGLIALYLITGHYYNKWLQHWGGWLDLQTRIWLIAVDLGLNLIVGLYYMNHRETTMGVLMMSCPIAISPLIFLSELVLVILYRRYQSKSQIK